MKTRFEFEKLNSLNYSVELFFKWCFLRVQRTSDLEKKENHSFMYRLAKIRECKIIVS